MNVKRNIRKDNEVLVLKKVLDANKISRAQLSKDTKLNKVTISSIVQELIDKSILIESGIGVSSRQGGRKPTFVSFNSFCGLVLSIDLGIDYISCALCYIGGEIIKVINKKNVVVSKSNVIDYIQEIVTETLKYKKDTVYKVIGMGISIHGLVNDNKIIFTPYYDLDEIDLYNILANIYDFNILLENEANLLALGESVIYKHENTLLCLSFDRGVGMGIINDSTIYKGVDGSAGEIGHMILYPDGRQCECGNKGCLEQYVSENSIKKEISYRYNDMNEEAIIDLYKNKDDFVINKLNEMSKRISIAINNIGVIYNPLMIVINSDYFQQIPELLNIVRDNTNSMFNREVKIECSTIGKQARLHGGVELIKRTFLGLKV